VRIQRFSVTPALSSTGSYGVLPDVLFQPFFALEGIVVAFINVLAQALN
jgi:hypothetical protein